MHLSFCEHAMLYPTHYLKLGLSHSHLNAIVMLLKKKDENVTTVT